MAKGTEGMVSKITFQDLSVFESLETFKLK